jgi:methionyl-tRNA formyltransferase
MFSYIAIGSGHVLSAQIDYLNKQDFRLLGILPDRKQIKFEWNKKKYNLFEKEEEILDHKCDFILVNEYGSLLTVVHSRNLVFNFHSGLLPKWRGKSSNLMCFINMERIFVSMHLVNKNMDDGYVISKQEINYEEGTRYSEVSNKISKACVEMLKDLVAFVKGEFKTELLACDVVDNTEINYSGRLNPEDGIITNFTWPLKIYRRFWLLFGDGSGLFVRKNDTETLLNIRDLRIIEMRQPAFILVGVIVNFSDGYHWINTHNGYLLIKMDVKLKIGTRLSGFQFSMVK